jgi:putative transposase
MITLLLQLLRLLPFLFGGHRQLALENLALRQQLAVYKRTLPRPKLRTMDRLVWVGLARVWTGWRQALVIVSPDTVLRWQRRRFREYWTHLSDRPIGGRPSVDVEIAALVRKMAVANPLRGAPRIHGELLKLGIDIAERTVSRLMPNRCHGPSQTWRTFLTNHVRDLVSIDFFTVPTARLRVLFVFVVLATTGGVSSTSMSPSIPLRPGLPSRSWTPSRTSPSPSISSGIVTKSTVSSSGVA